MKIETIVLGLLHTNCYIVYDEQSKECVVVDPATEANEILSILNKLHLNVKYIILTHAHSDHICALDAICDATNAKLCIGKGDVLSLKDDKINLCYYFKETSPTHTPDVILNDGDEISLDGFDLKVICTPGHTPGSISLLSDNILISGDTLFHESIGRTDFPKGNTDDIINSIKSKLYTLDPNTVVYPGHGDKTTIGHEINNNPFVW